jgi:MFS transporter, FSR family, fosmidomycin resistance protein
MSHFNMLVFPAVLLPLSAQFGMNMAETLALSFWMYLLFGVTALPWGLLADKIGPRPLLALFHLGAGLCGLLAAMNVANPLLFSLSLAGIGLFSGIYHPVGLGWIAKEVENISKGMAINGMFGNLGLASAPLLAGTVNYFWGAKAVYIVLAMVNVSGLVFLYLAKNGHRTPVSVKKRVERKNTLVPFLVLLVCMMMGGIVYRAVSVTLPAYFELQNQNLYNGFLAIAGDFGSPNVFATLITSTIYLVGMAGQYFGGKVGEKIDLGKGYLIFHLITIPAAIAMALTSNISLVTFAMIHSFFLLGMQPIENTLVARLSPPNLHSTAYGLKFILTFGVGALSVSMVAGIKEVFGFNTVYLVLAGISTLLVVAIVVLNYFRKKIL